MKQKVFLPFLWILTIISAVPSLAADIAVKSLDLVAELPAAGDNKLYDVAKALGVKEHNIEKVLFLRLKHRKICRAV